MSHSNYKEEDYLHLRVFEDGIPQKKGIALCPNRARSLLDIVDAIDAEADSEWETDTTNSDKEYFHHIGYGTYLRVIKKYNKRYYDVRKYFKAENNTILPTKQGLYMSTSEFGELKRLATDIIQSIPAIRNSTPCDCWFQPNQLAYLFCTRCSPFSHDY